MQELKEHTGDQSCYFITQAFTDRRLGFCRQSPEPI